MRERLADLGWTVVSLPLYGAAVLFMKAADRWLTRNVGG